LGITKAKMKAEKAEKRVGRQAAVAAVAAVSSVVVDEQAHGDGDIF
jgi:hypothetical protein